MESIIPDPPVVIKPDMEVIWSHNVAIDSTEGFITTPFIWNENLIYSTYYYQEGNTIQSRNTKTGMLNWESNDVRLGNKSINEFNYTVFGDEIIWENFNDLLNISLHDGKILQHERVIDAWMGPRCSIFNDFIYTTISDKSIQQENDFLVRRNVNGGIWDTLTTISKEDGFTPFIYTPTGFVAPSGDSMLLFSVGKWNFQESKGQSDYYCLLLKDRSIKWRLKDWDKEATSVLYPVIYDRKVYFQGHHSIYCVDIQTGIEKWRFVMPNPLEDTKSCHLIIVDNKLYIKGKNYNTLRCLDPQTGNQIWANSDLGGGTEKLQYANGMVMFTSHYYLCIVNGTSGKTIWKKKSPNSNGDVNFNGWVPIAVNIKDSIIYACDKQNIMAIKMPKIE